MILIKFFSYVKLSLMVKILDKDAALVLSGWLTNLSAGWFGSIFVLPIITEPDRLLLLTVNLPLAIMALVVSIVLVKKGKL